MKEANLLIIEIDELLAEVAHCVMRGLEPSRVSKLHHASCAQTAKCIVDEIFVDAAICIEGSSNALAISNLGIPVVEINERLVNCHAATLGELTSAIHKALSYCTQPSSSNDSSS